jgi:hypothetical protein
VDREGTATTPVQKLEVDMAVGAGMEVAVAGVDTVAGEHMPAARHILAARHI